ncbi:MAG: hypothetical protein K8F91_13970, partial [Candidatus Obscuribacterales bacterium]|nr:hypothetical protein [Candidatus Obscuribacterales bacterium]
SVSEKKLDVQVFEPGTNNYGPTYSQFFIRVPSPDNPDLASYELDAIREFDYQRIPLDLYGYREKHIARLIEFDPGEDNPAFMVIGEAFSYTDEKTVQYLNRDGMVIKEEKHSDDRKVPPVISEINPPRAPEKALVSSRFGYQPFDLPDYIDFPEIEITGPGAVK